MNITKQLTEVFVIPEYNGRQNVIRRVLWQITFEEDGVKSTAGIETFLDIDNIENFVPANEVGNELLLQWVLEIQGGDSFISAIQPYHEEDLTYAKKCAGLETYVSGFEFSTGVSPATLPAVIL